MILRVLLLISFTCCVSGTFVVNVTQSFYQAEENHNITLEWSFTTEAETSHKDISVYCEMISDRKASVLFHLHRGRELKRSQDDQFAGRVQCDKDVLREGRLRLHVSRLKIEDSGNYLCEIRASYDGGFAKCRLNVTAARDQPEPERTNTARDQPEPERTNTESRRRSGIYFSLGLTAAAVVLVCCLLIHHLLLHEQDLCSVDESECLNLNSFNTQKILFSHWLAGEDKSNLPAGEHSDTLHEENNDKQT